MVTSETQQSLHKSCSSDSLYVPLDAYSSVRLSNTDPQSFGESALCSSSSVWRKEMNEYQMSKEEEGEEKVEEEGEALIFIQ